MVRGPFVVGLAAVLFLLAFDDGAYGLSTRSIAGVTVWWALMLGFAVFAWPLEAAPRGAAYVGALLAAFAAWTLISAAWTSDREATVLAFGRTALYLGAFLLVVAASNRRVLAGYLDAITVAIVAITLCALVSRFFPSAFADRGIASELPGSQTRLSFPIGYWNGLGAMLAMGVPLLLRASAVWRRVAAAMAIGCLPLIAVALYLTSSRGSLGAAALGSVVLLATYRRAPLPVLFVIGAVGSAVAAVFVTRQTALVNGPLHSASAASEGHVAAAVVLLVCVVTGVVAAFPPRPRFGPVSVSLRRVGILVAVAIVVAAVVVSHPIGHFHSFTQAPAPNTIGNHLNSVNGSGRWQFWTAAVDEWKAHPLLGGGAGTFATWWRVHGSLPYVIQNAHSLFVETLGELGVLGLALIAAVVLAGFGVGIHRLRHARERTEVAAIGALLAVFAVWTVSAGLDWVYQLPGVTLVAFIALGALCGPATLPSLRSAEQPQEARGDARFGVGVLAFVGGWIVIAAILLPWFGSMQISASQVDAREGRGAAAASAALAAKDIEPWASTPYLQLALVSEQAGELHAARKWIGEAISRNKLAWDLWLVAARLDTKSGHRQRAESELGRAVQLNPWSPLFRTKP